MLKINHLSETERMYFAVYFVWGKEKQIKSVMTEKLAIQLLGRNNLRYEYMKYGIVIDADRRIFFERRSIHSRVSHFL